MDKLDAGCRKGFFKVQKGVTALFLAVLFFALFTAPIAPQKTAFAYNKTSAATLLDMDSGEVLYSVNGNLKMEIASTTKILTAICVIENGDIFRTVTVPKEAAGCEGSSVYLAAGDKWRVLDLLFGLMLRSGNDAALALAITTSGSVAEFVKLMNQTAVKAGAVNSNFTNPHGLHDDNHFSTANDMAKITAYAMKCPVFASIVKTKTHKYFFNDNQSGVFYNKNKLLYSYPYATGGKTGYTTHSGRCLVSSASKGGVNLICVVLNQYDTYGESRRLYEREFEKRNQIDG